MTHFYGMYHYVSVNSNWVHPPPGQPPGISSKRLPTGSGFDFWKLPGGREFDKGGDFVEIESETFCLSIGFISERGCRKIAENWGTLHCWFPVQITLNTT